MSATVESPMPCRRLTSGLFRSRSSQTSLAALTAATGCVTVTRLTSAAPGAPSTATCVDGSWQNHDSVDWSNVHHDSQRQVSSAKVGKLENGHGGSGLISGLCGRSASPAGSNNPARRGNGLSNQLNKLCHQLRFGEFTPIPACLRQQNGRTLSHSTEGLADLRVDPPKSPSCGIRLSARQHRSPICSSIIPKDHVDTEVRCNGEINGHHPPAVLTSETSPSVPGVPCGLVAEMLADCSLSDNLLILDCRTFVAYNANHIRGALNVSCSDCISRKRLMTGRTTIGDLVSGCDEAKDRYRRAVEMVRSDGKGAIQVIVYDEETTEFSDLSASSSVRMVVSCLLKDGFDVYCMIGGLKRFYSDYPCLCSQSGLPLHRLSASCPSPSTECRVDDAKISMILPFLFIGNEQDAANRSLLHELGIGHVLNVTSHVPLHFESEGVKYIRLSAADNGVQNLRQYFEKAIHFIDEVYSEGGRVMIHCQAGVSRSSTITIAYIMARSSLAMLDAFRFVKSRRPIVAPNFNFMGQLLDFEVTLNHGLVTRQPVSEVTNFIADCQSANPQSQQNGCLHDDVMTPE